MSDPTKPTQAGPNRTGIATSPIDTKAMIEGAEKGSPEADPDAPGLALERARYADITAPVGTMPIPTTLKGTMSTVAELLKGKKPLVFLDLLGERLAFERTGVRLYEALLVKLEAADAHPGGPTREELERIRDEELAHFGLVKDAMTSLGADPTAMTPSADVTAVASSGVVQVLADPGTTLNESLKAILTAELVDNDCWLTLTDLADRLGHTDIAAGFRRALAEEEDHLARVRSWVLAAVEGEAGLTSEARPASGARPGAPSP